MLKAISVAKATANRIFEIIERKPEIDSSAETEGKKPEIILGNIRFCDVHFRYPNRPEVSVLNGLSLEIKSGESIAFVGPSGSGKSTIVQLLQRFYDPQNGKLLVDDIDIKEWNLGYLRRSISFVSQEPQLFSMTIGENIAFGSHLKIEISDKEIKEAANQANCLKFIQQLDKGFDTYVSTGQLSGGQKQRIAIARALINCPKILVLDEATSALDLKSEAEVQIALERASMGRTTIIVAHRLSTVQHCDRICYIESGHVMEMGSHLELMAKKGKYFLLVEKQLRGGDAEEEGEESQEERSVDQLEKSKAMDESGEDVDERWDQLDEEVVLKKFSQRRLLRLLFLDKYWIIGGLLMSLFYGLIVPIYAFIFGAFVEVFTEESSDDVIWSKSRVFAFYYIGIAFAVGLISVTQVRD